jgi:uncharacterized membrane protein
MKTLLSLALIGFALGVVGHAIFNYAKTVNFHYNTAFLDSVIDAGISIVTSPWFLSGLAGLILLVSIALAIAYISPRIRS